MNEINQQRASFPARRRRRLIAGFLALLAVVWLSRGFKTDWLHWTTTTTWNPAFLEGRTWWHGGLKLPHRLWDTAYVQQTDSTYNVFPPLQSVIGFAAVGLARLGGDPAPFPEMHTLSLLVFGLPLPIVGYAVFFRRTGSATWGAVLTAAWLCGTAVSPCISDARNDGVHHINHLLSQVGLLLLAADLTGWRRIWPALIGLLIAAWSRQLTGVFGVALLVAAARYPNREQAADVCSRSSSAAGGRRYEGFAENWGRLAAALAGLAVIAAAPMGLNWAKFGSPFRNGYELIYVGRTHELALSARSHGLFSPAFLARDAYYMNAALPWARGPNGRIGWHPSEYGASLWLGTPLAVLALLGVRTWWREPAVRAMMLCTLPIIAALLLYHGTGQRQYGYWRFSLDFLPVWLVAAAPYLTTGWRRWATPVCTAWSLAYFAMVQAWVPT